MPPRCGRCASSAIVQDANGKQAVLQAAGDGAVKGLRTGGELKAAMHNSGVGGLVPPRGCRGGRGRAPVFPHADGVGAGAAPARVTSVSR